MSSERTYKIRRAFHPDNWEYNTQPRPEHMNWVEMFVRESEILDDDIIVERPIDTVAQFPLTRVSALEASKFNVRLYLEGDYDLETVPTVAVKLTKHREKRKLSMNISLQLN